MSQPLIEARGLTISFGGIRAVDDLDLEVAPGSITGLVGPNGSGKSSALNLVSGFYPAEAGEIHHRDARDGTVTAIGPLSVHERARLGIGRTFQAPRLIPQISAVDNVALGHSWHGGWRAWSELLPLPAIRERRRRRDEGAHEILERFNLDHRAGVKASVLSLGEQRIVELARAVHANCSVLLLDEPFAGVSRGEREPLGRELLRLAGEGTAVLLVEHNLDMVRWLASHAVVMDQGQALLSGPPEEALEDPRVQELYVGVAPGGDAT